MRKEDREEFMGIMNEAMSHIKEIECLHYENINNTLGLIHEQVKKTNGTVIKHTDQIAELQKHAFVETGYVSKKSLVKIVSLAIAATGLIVTIIDLAL